MSKKELDKRHPSLWRKSSEQFKFLWREASPTAFPRRAWKRYFKV